MGRQTGFNPKQARTPRGDATLPGGRRIQTGPGQRMTSVAGYPPVPVPHVSDADPRSRSPRSRRALGPQYRLERELGRGRDGRRLPRHRHHARPPGRHQGGASRARRPPVDRPPLPGRGPHHRPAPPPQHRRGSRRRQRRRPALLRHGRGRRARASASGSPREGRLDPAEAARIVADLAAALDAAGRAGVVHRDVKPENVLLDQATGRALLADFGIARAMAAEGGGSSTGQGVAVGTPAYMSPEQAAGEEIDSRSDLYALGVVAYEMLAGHPPFQGPNRVVVSKHIAERPGADRAVRPGTARVRWRGRSCGRWRSSPPSGGRRGEEFRQAVAGERPLPAPRRPAARLVAAAAGRRAGAASPAAVGLARRSAGPARPGSIPRHSILVLAVRQPAGRPLGRLAPRRQRQHAGAQPVAVERSDGGGPRAAARPAGPAPARGRATTIGLDMARRLAREAGVWTVVLGDFDAGRRLAPSRGPGVRRGQRQAGGRGPGGRPAGRRTCGRCSTSWPAKLLDLSGAPNEIRIGLARSTTGSLEAFRAYLSGVEQLNRWDLAGAERDLQRAIAIDTTFGLAYYKLALTRGWIVGTEDSIADPRHRPGHDLFRQPAGARAHGDQRLPASSAGEYRRGAVALPAAHCPGCGRRRCLVRPGRGLVPRHHQRGPSRPALDPGDPGVQPRRSRSTRTTPWPTITCRPC